MGKQEDESKEEKRGRAAVVEILPRRLTAPVFHLTCLQINKLG
jgi:hypothetical protein